MSYEEFYKPYIIEIKTNRLGWVRVRFLKFLKNNYILIKLKDGQILKRKNIRVRWGKVKRIDGEKKISKAFGRHFKTRKRLHAMKKKTSNKKSWKRPSTE